jgi:hypothetical protein
MDLLRTCYACDQPATSKEHVPPKSFFPKAHRTNLITVPSCSKHNHDNSKDVEYTRNVISAHYGTNQLAQHLFSGEVTRSFGRSPRLFHKTFEDLQGFVLEGMLTGAAKADIKRMETVMSACICAIHFRETGEQTSSWDVVFPNLGFGKNTAQEAVKAWAEFLPLLGKLRLSKRVTGSPEVFKYAVAEILGQRAYGMLFYEGFAVFAFSTSVPSPE